MNSTNPASAERELNRVLFERYPAEAARQLETMSANAVAAALDGYPAVVTGAVWELLPSDLASEALAHLDAGAAGEVLGCVGPRQAAQILAAYNEEAYERIMAGIHRTAARSIRSLMSHPQGTAGALMDPRTFGFRPGMTVGDAIDRLRVSGRRGMRVGFIVDGTGRLRGLIEIQDLALSPPETLLSQIERGLIAVVSETANSEEVYEALDRYGISDLPVVDFDSHLVGVIHQSALIDAAETEISATLQTMVGVSKEERALSRIRFSVSKRLPWLQINLITAFLAAAVVGIFESTIAKFTVLAILLPVVAGQSGNTGAQALAVTMRGLALGEIRVVMWLRVLRKEFFVGLINGIAVGVITSLGIFVWSGSTGLSLVILSSMILAMVIASLSGAAVPMLLTSLGRDPAASSSIILTTVTDVVGFFSFLGIATVLSGMLS